MLSTPAPIAPPQGFRVNFKDFYNLHGMENISETTKTRVGWAVVLTLVLWPWAKTRNKFSFLITDSSKPVSTNGADPAWIYSEHINELISKPYMKPTACKSHLSQLVK